jgi:sterol desaturase/sphingolipid hydroxylase (fatty acid hydroxylase superfamily)
MDPFGLKVIFFTCIVFLPLERLFALRREQKIFRRYWANDLVFFILNGLLIKVGLGAVFALTILAAPQAVPSSVQSWISGLPYWVQILAVLLIADLGVYWTHRMFHAIPWLWRFHEIHHSIEELDWLATVRAHPVDQIVTKGVSLIPIVALGFSDLAIGIWALLYQWQSVFVHSNLRIKFGPLRLFLASPEFHHWHHSNDREARDRNFAAQLPFLDFLFGTLHMPRGRMPQSYGLDEPMPQRYAYQILYPLLRERAQASSPEEAVRDGKNSADRELEVEGAGGAARLKRR